MIKSLLFFSKNCYNNSADLLIKIFFMKKHFTYDEAESIGTKLGITWTDFDVEQFRMGLDVELEHGLRDSDTNITDDEPVKTGKIAWAHLKEYGDYYTRLESMEREAEEYWAERKAQV